MTISPDQNTITNNGITYIFSDHGGCEQCDFERNKCSFPCTPTERKDGRDGTFKKLKEKWIQ